MLYEFFVQINYLKRVYFIKDRFLRVVADAANITKLFKLYIVLIVILKWAL